MASLRGHLLNAAIRYAGKRRLADLEFTPADIAASRARMERMGDRVRTCTAADAAQSTNSAALPPNGRATAHLSRGVILYCHGGGYVVGSPRAYRGLAGRLAALTHCDVAVIDYRLAPEHVYPAAPDDAIRAYRALLSRGIDASSIVIAGDSAGGNLALVTLLRARDCGLPLPSAAVLLSPWTDLTGSGDSMRTNAKLDPMLPAQRIDEAARMYAPDAASRRSRRVAAVRRLRRPAAPLDSCWHNRDPARRFAAARANGRRQHGVQVELQDLAPHAARVSDVRGFPARRTARAGRNRRSSSVRDCRRSRRTVPMSDAHAAGARTRIAPAGPAAQHSGCVGDPRDRRAVDDVLAQHRRHDPDSAVRGTQSVAGQRRERFDLHRRVSDPEIDSAGRQSRLCRVRLLADVESPEDARPGAERQPHAVRNDAGNLHAESAGAEHLPPGQPSAVQTRHRQLDPADQLVGVFRQQHRVHARIRGAARRVAVGFRTPAS